MTLGLCESIAELPTPPHTQTPCLCLSDSQSESLDQIPNNVAHSTEGKMARVCAGRGDAAAKPGRNAEEELRSPLLRQGWPWPNPSPGPEQESCTVGAGEASPTPTSMSSSGPAEDLHPDRSSCPNTVFPLQEDESPLGPPYVRNVCRSSPSL